MLCGTGTTDDSKQSVLLFFTTQYGCILYLCILSQASNELPYI